MVNLYCKSTIVKTHYTRRRLEVSFGDKTGVSIMPARKVDEKIFAPGTVVIYQTEDLPSRFVIGMIKIEPNGSFGKALVQGRKIGEYWRVPPIK
jgi:hypothetical protein